MTNANNTASRQIASRSSFVVGFVRADGSAWMTTQMFRATESAMAWAQRMSDKHGVRPICEYDESQLTLY